MAFKLPKIELAQGELGRNTRAGRRWFPLVAWALGRHPEGLFLAELKDEYRVLCDLQGTDQPFTDDGDFQQSLTRQLSIAISIFHGMGWLSFRLEKPTRVYSVVSAGGTAIPFMAERLWKLTKSGRRASRWHERKLARSIALHLFSRRIAPIAGKLRVPLALVSAVIGILKLASGWGEIQATLEGTVAIVGAGVLALIQPAHALAPD